MIEVSACIEISTQVATQAKRSVYAYRPIFETASITPLMHKRWTAPISFEMRYVCIYPRLNAFQ